jgi:hypothetical protein
MQLGIHLRELWRARLAVGLCLVLAAVVALWTTDQISLLPPRISAKSLDMAAASTHVLVDTPHSTVLDLRQGTLELDGMTQRAVLLGNVMASLPVRDYIARRAGVPTARIRVTTPITPEYPRPVVDPENRRRTSDLVRSTDQYRLKISANPTVPIIDVYSQAPDANAAQALANAAVGGLRDYLAAVAQTEGISPNNRVRLDQLGRAKGVVIAGGVGQKLAVLSFILSFGLMCALVLFVSRLRRGWRSAREAEAAGPPRSGTAARLSGDPLQRLPG